MAATAGSRRESRATTVAPPGWKGVDNTAEDDGDIIGALVGDDHVGNAVGVDVLDHYADRVTADRDVCWVLDVKRGVTSKVNTGAMVDLNLVAAAGNYHGIQGTRC